MSKNISRFIQISDAVLLEYCINKDYDGISFDADNSDLKQISSNDKIYKLPSNELMYADHNYSNMLSLPLDAQNSEYFNILNKNDISLDEYDGIYNTVSGLELEQFPCTSESIPMDKIKLHISSGYTFEYTYGFFLKVFIKSSEEEQKNAVLLNYAFNKTFSKYVYAIDPIFFSNRVYDKYIEIDIPSVMYLSYNPESSLSKAMNVKNQLNNINISYSDLYERNFTILDLAAYTSVYKKDARLANIECGDFNIEMKSITTIPLDAVSDNFNVNISENGSGEYIEYYSTWKGKPLDTDTVKKFNTIIPLYTISRAAQEQRYEQSGIESEEMWYVQHLIESYLVLEDGTKVLLDKITNTQFFNESNGTKFYYRPISARVNELGISVVDVKSIVLIYKAKLINAIDGTRTQILREGSLSVNPTKYLSNCSNNLGTMDTFNYTIYNKIYQTNQNISVNNDIAKIKYTKVFYDNSNINLSGNTGTYVLTLGNSPKNYKFTFSETDADNDTRFLNLSNSYYKMYSRDINGDDIYIDATYSENMNTVLGELEFYIPLSIIKKLKEVPSVKRFLSIVAVNQDNTMSTLYEFTYE